MDYNQTQQSYPPGYYQPPSGQNTVVVVQQPLNASTAAANGYPQNVQAWSTGFCSCCEDCGICALAFFCPWIHDCCLASKMNEFVCGPCCCGDLFRVAMRTKTRHIYGIKGDIMNDCCAVTCCPCCAMSQMHRELKHRNYF